MPNVTRILNEQIRRLARHEIKAQTGSTRRLTAQYRRDIAALKRQVVGLQKTVAFLEIQEKKRVAEQPVPEKLGDVRFRADGLKTHRARLGLSAGDYGKLVGVTGQTIYDWELGHSRPRKEQVAKVAGVRGIGKREAMKRLELLGAATERGPRKRGSYKQTGEELILSLLKKTKAMTSAEINAAWKKAGRPGICNYLISKLVAGRKLKMAKLKDGRGSQYSAV
ncbi:MAG: helix-turn-helix transcriptional regulator [Tepidisphaeraceae bacterium]